MAKDFISTDKREMSVGKRLDRLIAKRLGVADVLPFSTDDGAAMQILYNLPQWYSVSIEQDAYVHPRTWIVRIRPYRVDLQSGGTGKKLCTAICESFIDLTDRTREQLGMWIIPDQT